jgi:pSer/pThr/pTyr-binding forkhead associated (FHA) protein
MMQDAETGLGQAIQHGTLVFGSPALARPARLVQRTVEGVARDVYHLHRPETVIGRESGDIVFTDDPYLSRRHAVVRKDSSTGRFTLVDLESSNGTFIAIRGDFPISSGDSLRVGQHLFRIELAQG